MKKHIILLTSFLLIHNLATAQSIGVGTLSPSPSAVLDIQSTTQGMLAPRMNTSQRTSITMPAQGLFVYDTDVNSFFMYTISGWLSLQTGRMLADTDQDTKIMVEESTDEDKIRMDLGGLESIVIRKNANNDVCIENGGLENNFFIGKNSGTVNTGTNNTTLGVNTMQLNSEGGSITAIGADALASNSTGSYNTATGAAALSGNTTGTQNTAYGYKSMLSNVAGNSGTAFGYGAMQYSDNKAVPFTNTNSAFGFEALRGSLNPANNNGDQNTAIGFQSLLNNSDGENNVAIGAYSLNANIYGGNNIAVGAYAMNENSSGFGNIAIGTYSMFLNEDAYNNIAIGTSTLFYNDGIDNIAIGTDALSDNTSGHSNIGTGSQSLAQNTSGHSNTAVGYQSMHDNTIGTSCTAIGKQALYGNTQGDNNTALGFDAGGSLTTGNHCTFLGYSAESNAANFFNATAIGYQSNVLGSNRISIGNSTVSEIGGYATWTDLSDGRFKKNIMENVSGLDFIMKLRPVTYNLEIHKLAAFLKEDEHRDSSGAKVIIAPGTGILESRLAKEAIRHSGLIAQEVEASAIEAGFDFSGIKKPESDEDIYGLRYSEFIAPMIKAIQEQQQLISEQKLMIDQLSARLDQLEKQHSQD